MLVQAAISHRSFPLNCLEAGWLRRLRARGVSRGLGGYSRAEKLEKEPRMTLCPVAVAVGCKKCPLFKVCPAKTIIGNQKKEAPGPY